MEKHYVGMNAGKPHEVFKSKETPTRETHGHAAVMWPFETKRGAEYAAKYGKGNPHIQHVRDAERLAKQEHEMPHWKQDWYMGRITSTTGIKAEKALSSVKQMALSKPVPTKEEHEAIANNAYDMMRQHGAGSKPHKEALKKT